jgi:hypothetical protein
VRVGTPDKGSTRGGCATPRSARQYSVLLSSYVSRIAQTCFFTAGKKKERAVAWEERDGRTAPPLFSHTQGCSA